MSEVRSRWLILGGLGIAVVALVIGLAVTRASTVVNHTLSFSTAVPTRFAPDPAAFCRTLTTGGGLARMTQDTSRAGRFNLQVAVITADPRPGPPWSPCTGTPSTTPREAAPHSSP